MGSSPERSSVWWGSGCICGTEVKSHKVIFSLKIPEKKLWPGGNWSFLPGNKTKKHQVCSRRGFDWIIGKILSPKGLPRIWNREGWSDHSWECSQNLWMWCLGEHRLVGNLVILEVFSNWNNFVITTWKSCATSYTLIFTFLCLGWFWFVVWFGFGLWCGLVWFGVVLV